MKNSFRNDLILMIPLSLGFLIWFIWMSLQSPGLEGGMDSYQHYLIARYSWKYPNLFLHQWGKPVYTILASPFAQVGTNGLLIFNLLCWIGTSVFSYVSAIKLQFKTPVVVFGIALCAPILFDQMISGLTEPLSALLLSCLTYLLISKKWMGAAILAGFMPFARSEGFIIMAVAGFYLLFLSGKPTSFLWLLGGSFIMNSLGWWIDGKPFWIFTDNPYVRVELEKVNICGHGSFWHYFRHAHITFGLIASLLALSGIAVLIFNLIRRNISAKEKDLFWLVSGFFVMYFFTHSAIWYLGKMGSCGYIRVMSVIISSCALLSGYGYDKVALPIMNRISTKIPWHYLVVLVLTLEPFQWYGGKYPLQISEEQKLFVQANEWLKKVDIENRTLYFLYPYLNILADIDPWDTRRFVEIWGFHFDYADVGSMVIWDGHFGPNEGRIPLDSLRSHPDFTLRASFIPKVPFKTLNDYNFEIHIFERTGKSMLKER